MNTNSENVKFHFYYLRCKVKGVRYKEFDIRITECSILKIMLYLESVFRSPLFALRSYLKPEEIQSACRLLYSRFIGIIVPHAINFFHYSLDLAIGSVMCYIIFLFQAAAKEKCYGLINPCICTAFKFLDD